MNSLRTVLVIGAGPVGHDALQVLARLPQPPTVIVADRDIDRARAAAAAAGERLPVRAEVVDASDADAVARLAAGSEVVLHLGHNSCNAAVMRAALAAGAHYIDVSTSAAEAEVLMAGGTHEFDARFREAGLTAVSTCGNSPGMTNIVAMSLAAPLTRVDSVDIWTAWAFGADEAAPCRLRGYLPLYSTVLELGAYARPVRAFVDGAFRTLEPFTGPVEHEFPGGLGRMLMLPYDHGEPWSLPRHLGRGVKRVQYYYPVQPEAATLVLSGLASPEPVEVNGVAVSPIELVAAVVGPSLAEQTSLAGPAGLRAAEGFRFWTEVEVRGADDEGEVRESALWTLDTWAPDLQAARSLRERCGVTSPVAGFCAVVAARLVCAGRVPAGVVWPEALPADAFFAGMRELGLPLRYRRSSSRLATAG